MSRILITGSDGKIGKELTKILSEHEIMGFDKKRSGENLAFDDLSKIKNFEPEIIIHLAASFERTDESPQFHKINYEDNILASYRLLELVRTMPQLKQFIFASSYLVYDPFYLTEYKSDRNIVLWEHSSVSPRNLVGASKLYIENQVDFIKRNVHKNMNVIHARIFRVYGEGGQEFISRLIEWKKIGIPVDIWRPENRFDYIHTSDCASALKSLIGYNGVFNIGTGQATSIQSILEAIGPLVRNIQSDEPYEFSVADINKISSTTGWKPKVNVLDWIKSQL